VPYGHAFADIPLFKYGYFGVHLFFIISGFVILMTLEKCNNATNFLYRRWLRLFPAMLVCSLLVYCTAGFFDERPRGQPELIQMVPGLTLIEPYILEKLTGIQFQSLEGAFWSLYVEVKFYIFAAIVYFLFGARKLAICLFLCLLFWLTLGQLSSLSSNQYISLGYSLANIFSFEYFGWFSIGASYYLYLKSTESKWLYFGIFVSLISSMAASQLNLAPFVAALLISTIFVASILSDKFQKIMSSRFFLYLGFISYPLYLIHENMMISIVIKLNNYIPFISSFLFPAIAILIVSAVSYFISRNVEKVVKRYILMFISRGAQIYKSVFISR